MQITIATDIIHHAYCNKEKPSFNFDGNHDNLMLWRSKNSETLLKHLKCNYDKHLNKESNG